MKQQQKQAFWFRSFGGWWGVHVPANWQGWLVWASYGGLGVAGYMIGLRGLYFLALIITLFVVYHFKSERRCG